MEATENFSLVAATGRAVYSVDEFRSILAAQNHFLKTLLRGGKIFLIGDKRELANVASQRLGDITEGVPTTVPTRPRTRPVAG